MASKDLRRHISEWHENRKICDICEKRFDAPKDLKRHYNTIHERRKDYKCDLCQIGHGLKATLNTQIKRVYRN